jgi:hypothetical protein
MTELGLRNSQLVIVSLAERKFEIHLGRCKDPD